MTQERTTKSWKLQSALEDRKVVTFTYDKEKREVEIFYQGILKDTDNSETEQTEAIRGWQTSPTEDGTKSWKLFKVSDIKNLSVEKEKEIDDSRPGYNENDSAFSKFYARVIVGQKVSKV